MPISESSIISSVESQSENEGTTNTEVQKSDETSKEKSVSKENEQKPSDSTKANNKNTSTSPKKNTDKTEKETPTKTNAKSVQSSSTTIKQTRKETTTKKVITTTKKHTTTQKSFDVNHYVRYAKNYAKSIGLNLDSSCTDCWDNPINANANCSNIERDIKSRLNRYKNVEGFTDVWIWAESTGNGNYNIYIGYA